MICVTEIVHGRPMKNLMTVHRGVKKVSKTKEEHHAPRSTRGETASFSEEPKPSFILARGLEEGCCGALIAAAAAAAIGYSLGAIERARMDRELFDAAKDGNVSEVLRILLAGGANTSLTFGELYQGTPFHIACKNGHVDAVRALLLAKVDVEARDKHGDTALHIACIENNSEIVKVLLKNGADVRAENRSGETPLHVAFDLEACHSEVTELLLQNNADVNAKDKAGKTPLQHACSISDLQSVKLLVQHVQRYDDDVEARSNHLGNALIDALAAETFSDDVEAIAKVLLDSGAKFNVTDDCGLTALDLACLNTYVETVQQLVERVTDLEAPLKWAARSDSILEEEEKEIVVELLLDRGAKVNVAPGRITALHLACSREGSWNRARLLLDRGADLEAKAEDNRTPLHWACDRNGRIDTVQELVLRWGADVYSKGRDQKTPFDEANRFRGGEAVADFLLEYYEEKVWQQEGHLVLHAILREATNLENSKVQLPIGTLSIDQLLALLVSIHSRNPDSIHSQDSYGDLPLHVACRNNAPIKVLCFLVDQDHSTLHVENSAESLPIHEACLGCASLEKIKTLIEKGGVGTLQVRDNQGALPLHVLCQSNPTVDVVKYMVNLNPGSISETTSTGALPLMLACEWSASESVLQFLLTKYPEALDAM